MTSSTTTATAAKTGHVAVCPFPSNSHISYMLLLSRRIVALIPGLKISFFTAAGLSAVKAEEDGGSITIRYYDSGMPAGAPPPANRLEAIRCFMEVAPESLRKGMAAAEEELGVKIGSIVCGGMMAFACREIAEERGVKWAAVWVSSAGSIAAHMYTDLLLTGIGGYEGIEANKDKTVDDYIPGFPPIPIADLPHEIFAGADNPFGQILHHMSLELPKAATVFVNSFPALEPAVADILQAAFPNKFLYAAFFFGLTNAMPALDSAAQDPLGCLPWLDTHAPSSVVYIGFGVGHVPPLPEFTSLAEALEAAGVPFLWSLPDRFVPSLPEGFVERTAATGMGKVVPWAPQMAALMHGATGALLTHCGWNSVLDSVVAGVPMICRPMSIADLEFDTKLVCGVWGAGVEIEGGRMTKAATMVALERVLKGEDGRRAREKIAVMKRLAEEAVAEPDGSSILDFNKFINIITT